MTQTTHAIGESTAPSKLSHKADPDSPITVKTDRSQWIMSGLLVAALASIGLLRVLGQSSAAMMAADGSSPESVLSQLESTRSATPGAADAQWRETLSRLESPLRPAAPAAPLARSATAFGRAPSQPPPVVKAPTEVDPRTKELAQRYLAVGRLQLESILVGDGGRAVISGKVVTKGQEIEGWRVQEIEPKKVVLSWQQHTVELALP